MNIRKNGSFMYMVSCTYLTILSEIIYIYLVVSWIMELFIVFVTKKYEINKHHKTIIYKYKLLA